MSNKSYTLADGSTVTVTATEQGIPFNEGMDVITKAIKARVNVRDGSSGSGGGASSKLEPNFNINGFTKTGEGIFETNEYGRSISNTVNFSMDSDAQDIFTVSRNYVGGSSSVVPSSYPDDEYYDGPSVNDYIVVNVRDKTITYFVTGTSAIIKYEFYLYIPETLNYKSCLVSLRIIIDNE